jgi:CRP/FNR family transcriptional regulator, cyclic AMP receptor protein
MSELTDAFMSTPLSARLTHDEAEVLTASARERKLNPGQYLCHVGDAGNSIYVVLQGSLQVLLGTAKIGETIVSTVGPGQFVGEIEMMTQSLRVASLKAVDECRVLELPTTEFEKLLNRNHSGANKVVFTIAKTVSRRLATTNEHLMAKIKASKPPEASAPQEIKDSDIIPIDDSDLDVLDKLWS